MWVELCTPPSQKKICSSPNPQYVWMLPYLEEESCRYNQFKMKSHWIGMGPNLKTVKKKKIWTLKEGDYVTMEAKIGVTLLQAQEGQVLTRAFRGSMNCWYPNCGHQPSRTVSLALPGLWSFATAALATNTGSKPCTFHLSRRETQLLVDGINSFLLWFS